MDMLPLAPVSIGLVGLGRAGLYHRERLSLREDLRVVACYDSSPAVRAICQGDAVPCHEDWGQFLAESQVEVVWLATPPATHVELATDALRAGKHVVVEPPLSLSSESARQLLNFAQQAGKSLMIANWRRSDDDFRQAVQTVQSGALGQLQSLRITCWQYNPLPLRKPLREEPAWRDSLETGGGVLWEFGTHCFDQLLQLVPDEPRSVYACAPIQNDLTESFLAVVRFARGTLASLDISRTSLVPRSSGWELQGTKGCYSGSVQFTATPEGEVEDVPTALTAAEPDQFYGAVARHVREAGPNPGPVGDALTVLRLIEAVRESAGSGRVVSLGSPLTSQGDNSTTAP